MPVNIPITSKPRVLIIGGGFGGMELAKGLKDAEAQVVLVDKNNYHTFQPLLYQVATAALEPTSIAYPFREIFKYQKNFLFRLAEVLQIKPEARCVETSIGDIAYDYLVLAVGSRTNYFGLEEMEKNVTPMKTIPQAIALRNRMLENFERAVLTKAMEERESLMNMVIIGGGPTGVETAGALGELRKIILPRDYPELDFKRMQVHVVDMEHRLLKTMSPQASRSAEEFLKKFDVNLWLNTKVTHYDGEIADLSNGKKLIASTVIWAAGVMGAVIPGLKKEAVTAFNRIKVNASNQLEGYNNIFAIGDVAAILTDKTPQGHPMLAPVAIKQGRLLSLNLKRLIQKKSLQTFWYRDFGMMATIGRHHAVVDLPFLRFQGILAWFVWLLVHLMALVGFRNKLVAFVNWAWSYFTYETGLRLIIRPFKK